MGLGDNCFREEGGYFEEGQGYIGLGSCIMAEDYCVGDGVCCTGAQSCRVVGVGGCSTHFGYYRARDRKSVLGCDTLRWCAQFDGSIYKTWGDWYFGIGVEDGCMGGTWGLVFLPGEGIDPHGRGLVGTRVYACPSGRDPSVHDRLVVG